MRLFTALGRLNAELGEARLLHVVERAAAMRGIRRDAGEIVSIYRRRLGEAAADDVWVAISTDLVFRVPSIALAEAQHRHAPTRMYLFTHRSTGFGGLLGAAHATEIPYVFDNLDRAGVEQMLGPITDDRRRLATAMADAWVGFATDGRPTGLLAEWPTFDLDRRATMQLDLEPEVVDAPWDDERAVWM
jgi:para-nitrobenzyl esterase